MWSFVTHTDDGTCRLWGVDDGTNQAVLQLPSAVRAVAWHPQDAGKVVRVPAVLGRDRGGGLTCEGWACQMMVTDDRGTLRLVAVGTGQTTLTVHADLPGARDADWHPHDPLRCGPAPHPAPNGVLSPDGCIVRCVWHSFGMVGGTRWCLWNLAAGGPRLLGADETGEVHRDGAVALRWVVSRAPAARVDAAADLVGARDSWARHDGGVFATAGADGTVRFHHLRYPQVPQTHHVTGSIAGVAWHPAANLCAVAADCVVSLWRVTV
jgi:WD40 repeat protein